MFRQPNRLDRQKDRTKVGFVALVLTFITFAGFWQVRLHDFVDYDDGDYVFENAVVQRGLAWSGVGWAFTSSHASNWHPLTWLSHMLDCELFGLQPGGHHLTSLVLHALNTLLLFGWLRAVTARFWPGGFVAALFAIHPLHVESVAWVAERKDVLSTFFGLLALLAYARYAAESKLKSPRSRLAYGMTMLFYALSLMSKPMLVTLPFVLLLLDYWPLGRANGLSKRHLEDNAERSSKQWTCWLGLVLEKLPLFALSATSSAITFWAQRDTTVMGLESYGLVARLGNTCVAYVTYLRKLVWPLDLAFFYPLTPIPLWEALACGALVLAITLLLVLWRWALPYALVGWLWFLGMLVPVIGLVQVGEQALADRYTYLPAVGLFVAAAWSVDAWLQRKRSFIPAASALAVLGLACCGILTWQQIGYWKNSRSLLKRALAVTQDNFLAHNNLGFILAKEGDLTTAAQHFREAIRVKPSYARAHRNLAGTLLREGRAEEAANHYRTAVELEPNDAESLRHLGAALARLGKHDEAVFRCARAVAHAPQDALARYDYGLVLTLLGRYQEATTQLQESLRLKSGDPITHFQLGLTLERAGDWQAALAHFEEACNLRPDWPEALNEAAWLMATAPEAGLRNGQEAVRLALRANQLTGKTQPNLLGTLSAAYAAAGDFTNAIATAQQTIALADKAGLQQLVNETRARLKSYQAGQSHLEPPDSGAPE